MAATQDASSPDARRRPARRSALALVACAALALGAGCGSSDDGGSGGAAATGGTSPAQTTAATLDVEQTLADAYEGVVDEVPRSGPVAERGKTIWFSNCLGFEGCARFGDGVKAAARTLGWTLKEVDNQNDPSKSISIIRQAVAAGADGVIDTLSDCPNIKAGLQAAKAADIPVITYAGLDCDNPEFGGGEALYAAPFKLGDRDDALDYYREQGARDAEFIVALARKRGIEQPKVLQTLNENQLFQKIRAQGFAQRLREVCPDCERRPLEFTTEQLASGKGQQVFRSGMLRNPGMDVLYYANDAFLAPGLQPALEANKGRFKIVCCGDGGRLGIANVRRSGELADVYAVNAAPVPLWGWGAMDVMNRVLSGARADEVPGEAHVSFYVDPDHNLPADGDEVELPLDYESEYAKLWADGTR